MQRVVNYIIIFLVIIGAGVLSGLILLNVVFTAREVYVPQVVGMESVTALRTLNELQLNMVVVGQEFSPTVEENYIISQEPKYGSKVKKKKNIKVVLSLGKKKMTIPALAGHSLREARMAIKQRGLKLHRVSTVYDESKPKDIIIAQTPQPGPTLEKGGRISLLVSAGAKPKSYIMPDLVGKDIKEVAALLEEMGVEIGEINYSEYKGFPPGVVIKQDPLAGYQVSKGNKVKLSLSREVKGSSVHTGSFAMFRYQLPEEGGPTRVKIVVENESEVSEVFNAIRDAGTEVEVMVKVDGDTVARVYLDGGLVYEKRF